MIQLVFLLEERSMEELLKGLLPRILPEGVEPLLVPHEGRSDLRRSIPRKLRAWPAGDVGFVIVHDQDSAECRALKATLCRLCLATERPTLVRIPCHELESWYLGDLEAVEEGLGVRGLAKRQGKATYRDPDRLANAEQELEKLVGRGGQIERARRIGPHMDPQRNRSHSFQVFRDGLTRLVDAMRVREERP